MSNDLVVPDSLYRHGEALSTFLVWDESRIAGFGSIGGGFG
jgi:hypothetical protein